MALESLDHETNLGFDSASIRELRQLCVGNDLLFFAIIAILELSATDGYGLLEHPAEPEDDPAAASIWRLEVMQALLAMSHVKLERVAQGLLGSMSPKPTHLLALNLPHLTGTGQKRPTPCNGHRPGLPWSMEDCSVKGVCTCFL